MIGIRLFPFGARPIFGCELLVLGSVDSLLCLSLLNKAASHISVQLYFSLWQIHQIKPALYLTNTDYCKILNHWYLILSQLTLSDSGLSLSNGLHAIQNIKLTKILPGKKKNKHRLEISIDPLFEGNMIIWSWIKKFQKVHHIELVKCWFSFLPMHPMFSCQGFWLQGAAAPLPTASLKHTPLWKDPWRSPPLKGGDLDTGPW